MPLEQFDTGVAATFGLEADGIKITHIIEVSGLVMEQDVIEVRQNTANGKYLIKKLFGQWKAGQVVLTRGLTEDSSFERWIKDAQYGKMGEVRKGAFVIVYDTQGNAIKRYKLTNAWPSKLEIGTLKAGSSEPLTEKLTVVYERLEVE